MDQPDNESEDESFEANDAAAANAELIELCAVDNELFGQVFFPRAFRNESPPFHQEMDELLDSQDRYVCEQVFRGAAKTTKFRVYMAKRISYGLSRTILLVSKSQGHSTKTLTWIRNAVEKNTKWAQTFKLTKGAKWNDEELEIVHGIEGHTIFVVGIGITGSARGINFEDYRPDLILVDDVVDEENANTPEQRDKIKKLVHGALKYSLAPVVDNPYSKMVILQTPIAFEDISEMAKKDNTFKFMRQGCWSKETEDLPIMERKSAWEVRFPTKALIEAKLAAMANNEDSIFSREMEVKLITPEQSMFRAEWLQYYGEAHDVPMPPLHEMYVVMAVDPVPPPSPQQIAKGFAKKDYEAFAVCGKWLRTGKVFVLEISANRGHDPSWTIAEFFRLAQKWRPSNVIVESVAYQRTLSWLLKQGMQKLGKYWPILEMTDRRSKIDRISQGLKGIASEKQLYVLPGQTELINQFTHYPNVPHDDVLEVVAVACADLQGQILNEQSESRDELDDDDTPAITYSGGCP